MPRFSESTFIQNFRVYKSRSFQLYPCRTSFITHVISKKDNREEQRDNMDTHGRSTSELEWGRIWRWWAQTQVAYVRWHEHVNVQSRWRASVYTLGAYHADLYSEWTYPCTLNRPCSIGRQFRFRTSPLCKIVNAFLSWEGWSLQISWMDSNVTHCMDARRSDTWLDSSLRSSSTSIFCTVNQPCRKVFG